MSNEVTFLSFIGTFTLLHFETERIVTSNNILAIQRNGACEAKFLCNL